MSLMASSAVASIPHSWSPSGGVKSRKAGESQGWRWVSDGKGEFAIEAIPEATRGQ